MEQEQRMDIDQLRAFERIVREGSFSRAARALDITQPTISARIAALERTLGGRLFTRGGRNLTLTERGEQFLPYARRVLEVLEEGVEAARATQTGERGRETQGLVQSLTLGFLTEAVARFCVLHPQTEVFVRAAQSNQVVEMLNDGLVKLGILSWPFYGTDMLPLLHFREALALVVPASQAPAPGPLPLAQVVQAHRPFLLVQWSPSLTALLTRAVGEASPLVEVPAGTIRHLLLRGIGAAMLTRTLVADDLANGRLVEVQVSDLPPLYRDSAVVQLARGGRLPRAATEMVHVLRDTAAAYGILQAEEGAR
jgi:DNA-binding transcriptional LysR family regulator